jgi:hypothetical protein
MPPIRREPIVVVMRGENPEPGVGVVPRSDEPWGGLRVLYVRTILMNEKESA